MCYYVYMIRCKDNTIYTGITTDLQRRFNEHKKKTQKCAKYTYFHDAIFIECAWKCDSRSLACKLEYMIKRLNKKDKESLILGKHKLSEFMLEIDDNCYEKCNICAGDLT